jgi:hypothetical protein
MERPEIRDIESINSDIRSFKAEKKDFTRLLLSPEKGTMPQAQLESELVYNTLIDGHLERELNQTKYILFTEVELLKSKELNRYLSKEIHRLKTILAGEVNNEKA